MFGLAASPQEPRRGQPLARAAAAPRGACNGVGRRPRAAAAAPLPAGAAALPRVPAAAGLPAARARGKVAARSDVENQGYQSAAGRRPIPYPTAGGPLRDITNIVSRPAPAAFQPVKRTSGGGGGRGAAAAVTGPSYGKALLACEHPPSAEYEYVADILERQFRDEVFSTMAPGYMNRQAEVTAKMRAILVDWLVSVHEKFAMRTPTLFLTVNLVDRYLSTVPVRRKDLQLVGVVALLVATKFEEESPPLTVELADLTENAYLPDDILRWECQFLRALDFRILLPTPAQFLEHLLGVYECSSTHKDLAYYILELSVLDAGMSQHEPSRVAAAALLLSNELTHRSQPWPPAVASTARYSQERLKGCADQLNVLFEAANQGGALQAVRRKYSTRRAQAIAQQRAVRS